MQMGDTGFAQDYCRPKLPWLRVEVPLVSEPFADMTNHLNKHMEEKI